MCCSIKVVENDHKPESGIRAAITIFKKLKNMYVFGYVTRE